MCCKGAAFLSLGVALVIITVWACKTAVLFPVHNITVTIRCARPITSFQKASHLVRLSPICSGIVPFFQSPGRFPFNCRTFSPFRDVLLIIFWSGVSEPSSLAGVPKCKSHLAKNFCILPFCRVWRDFHSMAWSFAFAQLCMHALYCLQELTCRW